MKQNRYIKACEGCLTHHTNINTLCIFALIIGALFSSGIVGAAVVEQVDNGDFSDGLTGWSLYTETDGQTPIVSGERVYLSISGSGISRISQTIDLTNVKYLNCSYEATIVSGNVTIGVGAVTAGNILTGTGVSSIDVSGYSGECVVSYSLNSDAASSLYLDNISALRSLSSLYRPTASATIALMDESSSDVIMSSLGLDQPYVEEDSTGINFTGLAGEVFGVYGNSGLGPFALLIVFCMPFLGLWIMQKDLIIPGGIGLLFSGFVLVRLPADFQAVAGMMIALSITAVVYSMYSRR